MKTEFVFREPVANDLNFIQASFLNTIKNSSHLGRSVHNQIFFPELQKIIDNILSNAQTLITCLAEDPNVIIGFMIYEKKSIQFIFVKQAFRNFGVAKDMVHYAFENTKELQYAFSTKISKQINETHPNLIYNPFINYKKEMSHETVS